MSMWCYESAHKAALKFQRKRDFESAYGGAVAWARRNSVFEEITSHMEKCTLWNADLAMAEAKKYTNRMLFQKGSSGCVKWLQRHGLFEKACAHMEPQFRWTFDLVKVEAEKYSSRSEFHAANPSAAQWATRNKRMDELFNHKLTLWDLESVSSEALKYNNREAFRQGAQGAAQWAARNGVFDAICAHMELAGKCDYDCVYIWKPAGFEDLYKIGVTSKRLGTKRIEHVSGNYGFDVELLYIKTCSDALRKEKEMLSFGKPAKMRRDYDGFSEFRYLNKLEFLHCIKIMELDIVTTEASA